MIVALQHLGAFVYFLLDYRLLSVVRFRMSACFQCSAQRLGLWSYLFRCLEQIILLCHFGRIVAKAFSRYRTEHALLYMERSWCDEVGILDHGMPLQDRTYLTKLRLTQPKLVALGRVDPR
jgi:hypothetical protein